MYLIDTNVISEIRKGRRTDPNVAAWFRRVRDDELFLSVLVVGEIRQGIERLRPRDPRGALALERWLEEILQSFGDRILPIDARVAQNWGRLNAPRTLPVIDSLLAATAQTHGFTLVSRNTKDLERSGVRCLNPFEADAPPA